MNTHPAAHNNIADAIIAIQTELGLLPKGSFATVVARLNDVLYKTPGADQVIQPSGDYVGLSVKAASSQNLANLIDVRNSSNTIIGYWDRNGNVSAQGFRVAGTALASTHLSDSSALARLAGPIFTGVPAAPTPAADTNTTQIATTAYVVGQGYAKLASPTFTGTVSAPTATAGDSTTKVATTAFVGTAIANALASFVTVPTGTVMPYAGTSAPTGFLICDGTAVNRSTYSALFGIISTSYGAGDGASTFNIPDLRGRVPVGKGAHADVNTLGYADGARNITGISDQSLRSPKHSHTNGLSTQNGGVHSHSGTTSDGGYHQHQVGGDSQRIVNSADAFGNTVSNSYGVGAVTSLDGNHNHGFGTSQHDGHTHNIVGTIGISGGATDTPPNLVLNYIIKT